MLSENRWVVLRYRLYLDQEDKIVLRPKLNMPQNLHFLANISGRRVLLWKLASQHPASVDERVRSTCILYFTTGAEVYEPGVVYFVAVGSMSSGLFLLVFSSCWTTSSLVCQVEENRTFPWNCGQGPLLFFRVSRFQSAAAMSYVCLSNDTSPSGNGNAAHGTLRIMYIVRPGVRLAVVDVAADV